MPHQCPTDHSPSPSPEVIAAGQGVAQGHGCSTLSEPGVSIVPPWHLDQHVPCHTQLCNQLLHCLWVGEGVKARVGSPGRARSCLGEAGVRRGLRKPMQLAPPPNLLVQAPPSTSPHTRFPSRLLGLTWGSLEGHTPRASPGTYCRPDSPRLISTRTEWEGGAAASRTDAASRQGLSWPPGAVAPGVPRQLRLSCSPCRPSADPISGPLHPVTCILVVGAVEHTQALHSQHGGKVWPVSTPSLLAPSISQTRVEEGESICRDEPSWKTVVVAAGGQRTRAPADASLCGVARVACRSSSRNIPS